MPRRRRRLIVHLLILGYSSIVRRRVLPAAQSAGAVTTISIASRSQGPPSASARASAGKDAKGDVRWFRDYDEALRASGTDAVYVSGVNSEHERWITRALEHDLHVMVDKPALLDLPAAEAAVALAQRRKRVLAEATVFAFHPQVSILAGLLDMDTSATRVTAMLCLPPRPAGDFRLRADCGGGSLNDLGPYAAATSRLIFGTTPAHVDCRILSRGDVDTSFSVLLTHANGGAVAGHFGFVTAYQNRISTLTATRAIDVERFFTTPPDSAPALRITEQNREQVAAAPAADAFALFIEAFADAVRGGRLDTFTPALLADAQLLARMRETARRAG